MNNIVKKKKKKTHIFSFTQHFRFGSLIPFDEGSADQFPSEDMDTLTDGHRHVYAFGQEFPTCCGMRIPSAVAAKASSSGNAGSNPLPFD